MFIGSKYYVPFIVLLVFLSSFLIYLIYQLIYLKYRKKNIHPSSNDKVLKLKLIALSVIVTLLMVSLISNITGTKIIETSEKLLYFSISTFCYFLVFIILKDVLLEKYYRDVKDVFYDFVIWLIIFIIFGISLYLYILSLWQLFITPEEKANFEYFLLLLAAIMTFLFLTITTISILTAKKSNEYTEDRRKEEILQIKIDYYSKKLEKYYVPIYENTRNFLIKMNEFSLVAPYHGIFSEEYANKLIEMDSLLIKNTNVIQQYSYVHDAEVEKFFKDKKRAQFYSTGQYNNETKYTDRIIKILHKEEEISQIDINNFNQYVESVWKIFHYILKVDEGWYLKYQLNKLNQFENELNDPPEDLQKEFGKKDLKKIAADSQRLIDEATTDSKWIENRNKTYEEFDSNLNGFLNDIEKITYYINMQIKILERAKQNELTEEEINRYFR